MRPVESIQTNAVDLRVADLGRMRYAEALALQRRLQEEVIAARETADVGTPHVMHLLLVEHDPPVITVSRRPTAKQHLIATAAQLETAGVEVCETDRGGDITYHGPGQLVAYPILDLNNLGLRLHGYMRLLEQVVMDVLAEYNVIGERDASATGVWVAAKHDGIEIGRTQDSARSTQHLSKICAFGVRISRWATMHGLALNVRTNLKHFQLIVPCGLAGRPVTSMEMLLGEACPTMNDVKRAMANQFRAAVKQSGANGSPPSGRPRNSIH